MSNNTRYSNSIKNALTGCIGQTIIIILSFISRSVFIAVLGVSYSGLNGLFTNILSVLSLAELGIGEAIIFSLYKPIAMEDKEKIKSLMKLYKQSYNLIGILVASLGISIIPILKYIVTEEQQIPNMILFYILFLSNSVISYFYAYKKSIILANQKAYLCNYINLIISILKTILQIIVLLVTKSFILYLLIQIVFTYLNNVIISRIADKIYPFLNEKANEINKNERKHIFINIKALTVYKVGGILLNSIDNIIITKFCGLIWVGYIGNYTLIINSINTMLSSIFNSITASVGNLIVTENNEKKFFIFKVINLVNFWFFGLCTIALWNLCDYFIETWLSYQFVISKELLFAILLNFYFVGMHNSIFIFRGATGMFRETKFIILITAALNLLLSIILVNKMGILGVFIATFIARITTNIWYEPYILYKKYFKINSIKYFIDMIKYIIILCITNFIVNIFIRNISINGFIGLVVKAISVCILVNVIFGIIFYNTSEYKYIFEKLVVSKINHIKEKFN